MTLRSELDRACDAFNTDHHTIFMTQMMGHSLTYQGQPVTSLEAYDKARADFDARVQSARSRHHLDKLERLRDWDQLNSGLLHQLWAMIRGRA
ncbi:hypothetical protein JIX59_10700 [Brevundimonas diminuta]|uniref:hypothetical protein n=1 Tax=Brevundimonas diminuta TaxID=293 RepID=UPI00190902A8|nr:hypothetical protein [Brevundimonas diminuta]MBK1969805.1 hypothetical protein [Brevundimonas diminuta]